MDVWVNFKHATKWQAEGIFKCFFPAKPSASASADGAAGAASGASEASATAKHPGDATSAANLPGSKRKRATHSVPLLSEDEISELAKRFADAIPENELSVSRGLRPACCRRRCPIDLCFCFGIQVASLQGYLLRNKTRPRECVDEVAAWCVSRAVAWKKGARRTAH